MIVESQLNWLAAHGPQLLGRTPTADSLWEYIHPAIKASGRPKFDDGHYADAVESAFKEINTVVKALVFRKTGEEFDGVKLMTKAFSPRSPVIVLDDITTKSGRDIQLGYMELFAGAMKGIRNPKAHGNLVISSERALHHLFLASLLMWKLHERPSEPPSQAAP
jgi:uncharacterized protein (TIGR02391 family)